MAAFTVTFLNFSYEKRLQQTQENSNYFKLIVWFGLRRVQFSEEPQSGKRSVRQKCLDFSVSFVIIIANIAVI